MKALENNNLLKTLEERQDDSPFINFINEAGEEKNLINELDVETMRKMSALQTLFLKIRLLLIFLVSQEEYLILLLDVVLVMVLLVPILPV